MESNISGIKKRLNQALGECKTQASCTARRLVGQIKTIDRRSRPTSSASKRLSLSSSSTASLSLATVRPVRQSQTRRQFSYTFEVENEAKSRTSEAINGEQMYNECQCNCDRRLQSASSWTLATSVTEAKYYRDVNIDNGKFRIYNEPTNDAHLDYGGDYANAGDIINIRPGSLAYEIHKQLNENYSLDMGRKVGGQDEQQQVVEIMSDEDSTQNSSPISISPVVSLEDEQANQCELVKMMPSSSSFKKPAITIRPQQPFIRSTALNGSSRRRSSRRRRSARSARQVRFQPIPQSIDICEEVSSSPSPNTSLSSCDGEPEKAKGRKGFYSFATSKDTIKSKYRGHQHYIVGKLKQHKVHLPASAKPLAKKLSHNLSQIKLNKIKLKSFNNLAQSLNQTLSISTKIDHFRHKSTEFDSTPKFKSSRPIDTTPKSPSSQSRNNNNKESSDDSEDFSWGSDFDEQSIISSLISSNLNESNESNHSGSHDSGHSTEHSGCSSDLTGHRNLDDCQPETPTAGHSDERLGSPGEKNPTTTLTLESDSSVCHSPKGCQLSPSSGKGSVSSVTSSSISDNLRHEQELDLDERRNRFLQNRLIINSKLESMFKSRTNDTQANLRRVDSRAIESSVNNGQLSHTKPLVSRVESQERSATAQKLPQLSPKFTPSNAQVVQQPDFRDQTRVATISSTIGRCLDAKTRCMLLEQQREMSIKLKQKPRRRMANKLFIDQTNTTQADSEPMRKPLPPLPYPVKSTTITGAVVINSNAGDSSFDSIGTIDGLEYNRDQNGKWFNVIHHWLNGK